MPADTVLDGYSLSEQHLIDHEFLQLGSALSTQTPILLILLALGVLGLIAAAIMTALGTGTKTQRISLAVLSMVSIASKYLWVPLATSIKFSDAQLLWYSLKVYSGYWQGVSLLVIMLEIIAVAVIAIAARAR